MNLRKTKLAAFLLLIGIVAFSCKRNETVSDVTETTARSGEITTVKTFNGALLNINQQGSEGTFNLPQDVSNVKKILMYLKLDCGDTGCPAWDVFANVFVKNKSDGKFYEMARYITPYRKSNAELGRGFVFDVTDFKMLLSGSADLKIYTENWSGENWKISVEFDYEAGAPDYKYYAIAPIMQYNAHSLAGIPYGVQNDFKVKYQLQIPANAEQTSFRTIISGWGHADNTQPNGNCAEWCARTHHIYLDGVDAISHEMNLLPCDQITIKDQAGNWQGKRAGWCPGMEVPTRSNVLSSTYAGKSVSFEYKLQPWTNTMQGNTDNKNAYYAISTFLVVKSNTPITSGLVVN